MVLSTEPPPTEPPFMEPPTLAFMEPLLTLPFTRHWELLTLAFTELSELLIR